MPFWTVDFLVEPEAREVSVRIEADTSRGAMMKALAGLKLEPDELLHTLFAHIGRPVRK